MADSFILTVVCLLPVVPLAIALHVWSGRLSVLQWIGLGLLTAFYVGNTVLAGLFKARHTPDGFEQAPPAVQAVALILSLIAFAVVILLGVRSRPRVREGGTTAGGFALLSTTLLNLPAILLSLWVSAVFFAGAGP